MSLSGQGLTTIENIDLNEILYGTVIPVIDLYNKEETLDIRAMITSDWTERYFKFDASGHWKFMELGEAEIPRYRSVVWGKKQKDTKKYGLGLGYTYDWLISEQASVEQIRLMTTKAINRDRALQTAIVLDAALTSSTDGWYNGSFAADEKMSAPPTYGNVTFAAGHTHYVASGNASFRLADVVNSKELLKEHGYLGPFMGFASADTIAQIENLAGWASRSSTEFPVQNPVVNQVAVDGFAGRLLGVDWKETQWMPDNYVLVVSATATEGRNAINFVQKENASARGLLLLPGSGDMRYPIINSWYARWSSAQTVIRAAGVVTQFTTGSYSSPNVLANVVE